MSLIFGIGKFARCFESEHVGRISNLTSVKLFPFLGKSERFETCFVVVRDANPVAEPLCLAILILELEVGVLPDHLHDFPEHLGISLFIGKPKYVSDIGVSVSGCYVERNIAVGVIQPVAVGRAVARLRFIFSLAYGINENFLL